VKRDVPFNLLHDRSTMSRQHPFPPMPCISENPVDRALSHHLPV